METLVLWTISSLTTALVVGVPVGFLLGGLPGPSASAAVAVTVAAGALDLGGVTPPSVRRQVPQLWGRIFDPRFTAVLYGARLGIGPATMLASWLWWSGFGLAALGGPARSALFAGAFALARTATHLIAAGKRRPQPGAATRVGKMIGAAAIVLSLAVLLTGCSGDDQPRAQVSTAVTEAIVTSVPESVAPTAPADSPAPGLVDLAAALPLDLSGYEPVTDRPGADASLDVTAAAAAEVDPEAERELLTTRGFVQGHTRAWRDAGDRIVVVTVFELADPAEAALYLEDGFITLTGFAAPQYEVRSIAGARGFTQDGSDGFRTQGIALTIDRFWLLVYVNGPPATTTPDEVARVAGLVVTHSAPLLST